MLPLLLVDTGPRVLHDEEELVGVEPRHDRDRTFVGDPVERMQRILDEVQDDLLQLDAIPERPRQGSTEHDVEADAADDRLRAKEGDDLLDDFEELPEQEPLGPRRLDPRLASQLTYDVTRPQKLSPIIGTFLRAKSSPATSRSSSSS